MRYHALACDYDGTVAHDGRLADETRAALERLRASGRKIVLVTGRQVEDLEITCPDLSPFEVVVGENGAVLFWPKTREWKTLAEPPPAPLVEALKKAQLPRSEVSIGHVVIATWQPHETQMLDLIRDLGLEMQVVFNKGAVMVLPSGVNKATGLMEALTALRLSPHNVVAIGDAENDHALLAACECGAAVANALPMLKERADVVTTGDHGAGVVELVERLLNNDLSDLAAQGTRHDLPIGTTHTDQPLTIPAHGTRILLAGSSGAGKSTLTTAFLEQLQERQYQYCLLDPEGDYSIAPGAVPLGTQQAAPGVEEVVRLLERPADNAVASLVALKLEERPGFIDDILPRLQLLRAATGRPHWIVLDEVHHLAPADRAGPGLRPEELTNLWMVTVHPEHVALDLLQQVDGVIAMGIDPAGTLNELATTIGLPPPRIEAAPAEAGEALMWWPRGEGAATRFRPLPPKSERRRHTRKYAEGDLPPDRSFFFRGAEGKLNLRAQNLKSFLQLGDGVDDDTWLHHLRAGDYSTWLAQVVKDAELAAEVEAAERAGARQPPNESRRAVRDAIERRYTASA